MRLLFTRNNSTILNRIITALISWFTWSKYTHVELLFSDDVCISSEFVHGVVKRPRTKVESYSDMHLVIDIPVSADQENIIRKFAEDQVGKPYDFGAVIGFPFRGKWDETDKWFCSELCAAAFKKAGVELIAEDEEKVTPRDILVATNNVMMKVLLKNKT